MAYEELFTDLLRAARIVLHVRAEKCERMGSVPSVPAFVPCFLSPERSPTCLQPLTYSIIPLSLVISKYLEPPDNL